jgi:hypothetical protein
MPNGEGTQPLKGFQNSNLNFKLTIATFQIYFGNSPTFHRACEKKNFISSYFGSPMFFPFMIL